MSNPQSSISLSYALSDRLLTPVQGRVSKKVSFVCRQCGQQFFAYRYYIERRHKQYCSSLCQQAAKTMPIPDREELEGLYRAGVSTNGLAHYYGVSKGIIHKWMKALGIVTRSIGDGVSLTQTGVRHTDAHNAAIAQAHLGKTSLHMVGRNNPIFKSSSTGMHYSKGGIRPDLGIYVRSAWEANYSRYLNFLQERGMIISWAYEPETFVFPGITRGCISYTPDFRVTFPDNHYEWHEVKGWMDPKSKTRLERMAQYFPHEKIVLIEKAWFQQANRSGLVGLIPNWEGRLR